MDSNKFWETMGAAPEEIVKPEESEEESRPAQLMRDMPRKKTRYTLELGYRTNEIGHPSFPWPSCVEQNDSGRVLIDINKWYADSSMPVFAERTPFPFPFSSVSEHLRNEDNVNEWHFLMSASIHLPFFIYTPPVFLLLNAVPRGREINEHYWQAPVQLSTDVILCYHQVMWVLGKGNTRSATARKEIFRAYEQDLAGSVAKLLMAIRGDKQFQEAYAAGKADEALMHDIARYLASHTIRHIKIMEAAILRLSGVDDLAPESPVGQKMFVESAVPDPADERIKPFADALEEHWLESNVDYIGCKYELLKLPKPKLVDHYSLRGLHVEAMWNLFTALMNSDATGDAMET